MHELSIANGIVEMCAECAGDARVIRVRLEIGRLSAVLPDAVRFCFDVCARNTVVEGAELEIIETQGLALCRDCNHEVPMAALVGRCTCGSANLRVIAGEELRIKDMELA
jgi:hydrogenase nickel incorporation protein HypA/HybF